MPGYFHQAVLRIERRIVQNCFVQFMENESYCRPVPYSFVFQIIPVYREVPQGKSLLLRDYAVYSALQFNKVRQWSGVSRDCRGIGTAERKKAVEIFDSGGNHETANRGVGPDGFVVKHVHSDEMTYLCYGTVGKSEPFQHAFGDVRRNRFMAVKSIIAVIIHGPGTGLPTSWKSAESRTIRSSRGAAAQARKL